MFCSVLGLSAAPSLAQPNWSVPLDPTMVSMSTRAWGNCSCPVGGVPYDTGVIAETFFPGSPLGDLAWESLAQGEIGAAPCNCRSRGDALVRVSGVDTPVLRVQCDSVANAKHNCRTQGSQCSCPSFYRTGAYAILDMSLLASVAGAAPGTPLVINYRWRRVLANMYRPEDPPGPPYPFPPLPPPFPPPPIVQSDDSSWIYGGGAGINGTGVVGGGVMENQRGGVRDGGSGSLNATAGAPILITYGSGLLVQIAPSARGTQHPCLEYDSESVAAGFDLILTVGVAPSAGGTGAPELPVPCSTGALLVEVKIGSDKEMSDPTPDGNEVLDPGDGYMAPIGPLPASGADGISDDFAVIGGDMPPNPPDGPPHVTGAPTCSGAAQGPISTLFFERDAMDQLDFSLSASMAAWPQTPIGALGFPISRSAITTNCIYDAEFLAFSFADKGPAAFVNCDVPTTTTSVLSATYGAAAERDEVMGLIAVPAVVMPGSLPWVAAEYPLADEEALGLGPNPPSTTAMLPVGVPFVPQDPDDDVGGLSAISAGTGACAFEYFSTSHEAAGPPGPGGPGTPAFDPGNIYQRSPGGGIVQVISKTIHLGIAASTDIDAIEFVWLPRPAGDALALLYSVAPNDPGTAGDESGGLNPNFIYYSFLTGTSGVLIDGLEDNVDALTNYCEPLGMSPSTVVCSTCTGDVNGDNRADGRDIQCLASCVVSGTSGSCSCACADMNGDLIANAADVPLFVTKLLINPSTTCP